MSKPARASATRMNPPMKPDRLFDRRASHQSGGGWRYLRLVGFGQTFASFKLSTRVLLIVSLILGIAALVVGLILDETKPTWLDGLNYLPNIWAALTGFLIGAPVALIVLATFTVQREDRTALQRVNRLTEIAWKEFRDNVFEFCSDERLSALTDGTSEVQRHHDEIVKAFAWYRNKAEQSKFHHTTQQEYDNTQSEGQRTHTTMARRYGAPCGRITTNVGMRYWRVGALWINTFACNVWKETCDGSIVKLMPTCETDCLIPKIRFSRFSETHEMGRPNNSSNMFNALGIARGLAIADKDKFDKRWLGPSTPDFPFSGVTNYSSCAGSAASSLLRLRDAIQQVEAEKWPASATTPSDEVEPQ